MSEKTGISFSTCDGAIVNASNRVGAAMYVITKVGNDKELIHREFHLKAGAYRPCPIFDIDFLPGAEHIYYTVAMAHTADESGQADLQFANCSSWENQHFEITLDSPELAKAMWWKQNHLKVKPGEIVNLDISAATVAIYRGEFNGPISFRVRNCNDGTTRSLRGKDGKRIDPELEVSVFETGVKECIRVEAKVKMGDG